EPAPVDAGTGIEHPLGRLHPVDVLRRFAPEALRVVLPAGIDLVIAAHAGIHGVLLPCAGRALRQERRSAQPFWVRGDSVRGGSLAGRGGHRTGAMRQDAGACRPHASAAIPTARRRGVRTTRAADRGRTGDVQLGKLIDEGPEDYDPWG